jgi:hypothetical protein
VAPGGGGREKAKAAQSRRAFQRRLAAAVAQAENVPSMDVTGKTVGTGTTLNVDRRVAEAAGLKGASIGRVVRQPDGRFRAESAHGDVAARYFRSGIDARNHLISTTRSKVEARVGGEVPLSFSVPTGGTATARASARRERAVAIARRERIPLSQARRFVR